MMIGGKLSFLSIISTAIIYFLFGFKFTEAFFFYDDLVSNPQEFMLSSRGNVFGGIIVSIIVSYNKWRENEKYGNWWVRVYWFTCC